MSWPALAGNSVDISASAAPTRSRCPTDAAWSFDSSAPAVSRADARGYRTRGGGRYPTRGQKTAPESGAEAFAPGGVPGQSHRPDALAYGPLSPAGAGPPPGQRPPVGRAN